MDFEKMLGLEPIKSESQKRNDSLKEAIDDFVYNPDAQRTTPLPEFDYLFTNWPNKNPSEKPYKPKISNQLDKNISFVKKTKPLKKESELTPEEQAVLKRWNEMRAVSESKNRFESSMRKLSKKPWHDWNKLEWKIAGRVTKKKNPECIEAKGKIFSIKPLLNDQVQESITRLKSKSLVEMQFLDSLFKMAMTAGHAKPDKEEGQASIYSSIEGIVSKIMKDVGLKATNPKKYDDADVMGINYKLKVGKESYAIHTYLIKGNKLFMCSIWDKEENRLLLTVNQGYLRQHYYLVGIGKERLRSWMESLNGQSDKNHG